MASPPPGGGRGGGGGGERGGGGGGGGEVLLGVLLTEGADGTDEVTTVHWLPMATIGVDFMHVLVSVQSPFLLA